MTSQIKHRLGLLFWVALTVGNALMPLQWSDPYRMIYVLAGSAIAIASAIKAVFQWNKKIDVEPPFERRGPLTLT
jgi:hypothetical protein